MSRCLKCGSSLPPVGECTTCCAGVTLAPTSIGALYFDRALHLDRRQNRREPEPLFTDALHEPAPQGGPSFELPPEPVVIAAPTLVEAPLAEAPKDPPASLLRRALAWGIDGATLLTIATLYVVIGAVVTGATTPDGAGLEALLVPGAVLLAVLAAVYCVVAALFWSGTTLGRMLTGIQLVDETGSPPAPGRVLARAGLALVSFLLLLSGFSLALFDRRSQTLHDKLTSTFVVRPS